jgi:hypothetical protein
MIVWYNVIIEDKERSREMIEQINWKELAERGEEIIQERMATDKWYCHLVEQNAALAGYEADPSHQVEAVDCRIQNEE